MQSLPNPFLSDMPVTPEQPAPLKTDDGVEGYTGANDASDTRARFEQHFDEAAFMAALAELASDRAPAFIRDPRPEYLAATQDARIDMRLQFATAKQFQPIFDLLRAA